MKSINLGSFRQFIHKIASSCGLKIIFFSVLNCTALASTQSPRMPIIAEHQLRTGPSGISSNPSAVNAVTGTGTAQAYIEKQLGIRNNHGIRIGGMLIGDTNALFSGGVPNAEQWTENGLLLLSLSIDTEKFNGWKGGMFDIEYLQFNGQDTNGQAGSVQGYNSLPGPPPLSRSELYQLWYRQELFSDKLVVRVGKTVPTFDFANVIKPVALNDSQLFIPSVSGLIYTPLFVDPSLLGVMPGYYNSAYGITLNFAPVKQWYVSYGAYDGSLAQGIQTGIKVGPTFNGSYFNIAETGLAWLFGKEQKPGNLGIGVWHQSGLVQSSPTLTEQGAAGYYIFGAQRLWYKNPSQDSSGISYFYQYGRNNSTVLPMKQYVGAGLTAFGLVPKRLSDSMGIGVALSWLNQISFSQRTEFMAQAYYQAQIIKDIYIEPAVSYIPHPGANTSLTPTWAGTLRAIALF